LLFDGILLGRASTGVRAPLEVAIVSRDEAQTIDVHIPSVEVTLPKGSEKNLIALDDDRSIEISDAPMDPEEQRRLAKGTGTTTLKVRLGKQVRIKRGGLDVPVAGAITVAPDGRISGSITFPPGGVVPALGQIFRIRRGVVSFKNEHVENGTLAIQAWTRVAEGTLIDLDVSGNVSEPVIAFHSDPPRSEDEIVALLLGIQTNETSPESNESEQLGRTAMALAMNRLVEDSMLSGLQFGAGETGSGDSVSTVTMRVGSKVWFEGRTVRGSQHSVNPDERSSGVVDWRFAPSWSLRTQLGEVSGVEIRWSLRY
jgi:autotransporter translocation and assembly factor TamB